MITTPLILDLAANLLAAFIYRAVARLVASRPVEGQARIAAQAFATWWYVLAALSVYGVLGDVVTMGSGWTVPLLITLTHVLLLAILMAIAALVYYLVYLYTGKANAWKPILGFYGLFWVYLVYYITALEPNGIKQGPITATLTYVHDPALNPYAPVLGLVLIVPIIAAAVAYFTLFFKVREPTQRYRIAVVALSIALWFSFSLVGTLFGVGVTQSLQWLILSRLVSVGAAAGVYAAYRPPHWVRQRWGVQAVSR